METLKRRRGSRCCLIAAIGALIACGDGAAEPTNDERPSVELFTQETDFPDEPFTVDVVFSEPVFGFDLGDISAVNASLSELRMHDAATFSVTVTPGEQHLELEVRADRATNAAGQGNEPSNLLWLADLTDFVVDGACEGPEPLRPCRVRP